MPSIEIRLDLAALDKITREAQNSALETMGAVRGEILTAQVTPKDTSKLEGSGGAISQEVQGNETVTSLCLGDTPYARRLYFHPEYNFQTVNNPNARGEWAEPWTPGGEHEDFIPDTYQECLKRRLPR